MGEHAIESIYEVQAGDNLGWALKRVHSYSSERILAMSTRCPKTSNTATPTRWSPTTPIPLGLLCTQDSEHAVVGGFVYRGAAIPDLRGKYVFGDSVDGRIFYADADEMRRGNKQLAKVCQSSVAKGVFVGGRRTWLRGQLPTGPDVDME
jgi:hypothetical protein